MDDRKQRKKEIHGDATYPEVSTYLVLTTETIDAHGVRDVGIFKIPGEFISADMEKDVKTALRGNLEELMVKIGPQI